LDRTGILLDFRALKEHVAGVLKDIDHADLNALPEFRQRNPTSENIARLLYRRISSAVDGRGYRVTRVSVHETPETTATYWED
jgi:6-pyruvoyltetrahydropterin/6-carboxytetrahydropterin synthase